MEAQNQLNEQIHSDYEFQTFLLKNPGLKKSLHFMLVENARLILELNEQKQKINVCMKWIHWLGFIAAINAGVFLFDLLNGHFDNLL